MGDLDRIVVVQLICSSSMMRTSWCGLVSAPPGLAHGTASGAGAF
jgi:hypothetical protein